MEEMLSGRIIDFSDEQFEKHTFSISIKDFERFIDSSEEQNAKHASFTNLILSGRVIDFRD
jgi:hypothetical protein